MKISSDTSEHRCRQIYRLPAMSLKSQLSRVGTKFIPFLVWHRSGTIRTLCIWLQISTHELRRLNIIDKSIAFVENVFGIIDHLESSYGANMEGLIISVL